MIFFLTAWTLAIVRYPFCMVELRANSSELQVLEFWETLFISCVILLSVAVPRAKVWRAKSYFNGMEEFGDIDLAIISFVLSPATLKGRVPYEF